MQNKAQLDKSFVCAGNMVLFHIEQSPLNVKIHNDLFLKTLKVILSINEVKGQFGCDQVLPGHVVVKA